MNMALGGVLERQAMRDDQAAFLENEATIAKIGVGATTSMIELMEGV